VVADARVPADQDRPGRVTRPGASWRPSPAAASYIGVVGLLAALIAVPLAIIVLSGIFPGFDIGSFERPFAKWQDVLSRPELREDVLTTVRLGGSVALLATALGVSLGFLVSRTDLPARPVWDILLTVPFLTPPFIGAFAWILVLQPKGYLAQLTGQEWPTLERGLMSFSGVVVVMALHLFPFVYLAASRAFTAVGASREAAARTLGAGAFTTWRRITLPLALPALLGGALLVFVMAVEEFGTAATLGRRARVYVLAGEIEKLTSSTPVDRPLASALATILLALAGIVFLAQAWILARRSFVTITGREVAPERHRLGVWRLPATVFVLAVATLGVFVPWGAVLLTSLLRTQGGGISAANFTISQFAFIVSDSAARSALFNSLTLAAVTATLAVVLALAAAYLIHRTRLPGRTLLDGLTALPNAIPGIVLAVGILIAWNVARVPIPIYRSPAIIVAGYLALFIPIVMRFTDGRFRQIGTSPEDAARVLGASWLQRYRRIMVPMLSPALLAGWTMVFMVASRELVTSLVVRPPGFSTAAVYIFQSFEQGDPLRGMAMAVLMMGTTTVGLLILQRVTAAAVH
jgi:iron(III) transport system permease protein